LPPVTGTTYGWEAAVGGEVALRKKRIASPFGDHAEGKVTPPLTRTRGSVPSGRTRLVVGLRR
jgi:hypothetical protein